MLRHPKSRLDAGEKSRTMQQKIIPEPFPDKWRRAAAVARRFIVLIIALLPLFSALIFSYHYHSDLKNNPDCAICKSAQDLSSGDKQEPLSLVPQEITVAPAIFTEYSFSSSIFVCFLSNRAPPA